MCLCINRHLVSDHEISRLQHGLQLIMARYTRIINCRPCCNLYIIPHLLACVRTSIMAQHYHVASPYPAVKLHLQQISACHSVGFRGSEPVWCRQINNRRVETELYGQRRRAATSASLCFCFAIARHWAARCTFLYSTPVASLR